MAGNPAKSSLREDAETGLHIAQSLLKDNGEVAPFVLLIDNKKRVYSYLDLSVADKEEWKIGVERALARYGGDRIVAVTEAWSVASEEGELMRGMPVSENPLRSECLVVFASEHTGEVYSITQQFLHDPDGIKLMAPLTSQSAEVRLFPTKWRPTPSPMRA